MPLGFRYRSRACEVVRPYRARLQGSKRERGLRVDLNVRRNRQREMCLDPAGAR
jgi:hypothetical protein